ncbi:MAG: mechanosensitive ion channel [Terrimonas sp.]|nr:mechanosensitive ion channel [Terrimonas sp.]
MDWQELLRKTLFEFGKYSLTVSQLLVALAIFLGTKILLVFIRKVISSRLHETINDKGNAYALFQLFRYFIWIFSTLFILDTVGITLTYLLAGSAALFVGLGLGLQDVFKDMASGVLMLIERNVKIDDVMEVGGIVGRITRIGVRTSTLKTRDGISMIIPNSSFVNEKVINWSNESEATRFSVSVGVSYSSDEKLVKQVLLDCVVAHKDILHEGAHAPLVRFINFGDSSLDFELLFWTNNIFPVENIKSDIRFAIAAAFRQHQITIPFPQRDLHIISDRTKQSPD